MRTARTWGLAALTALAVLVAAPIASAADPVEGQRFTGVVATFDAPVPVAVTIDWGDGQTSTSNPVTLPSGKGEVTGSHIYATHGSYSVKTTDSANADNYVRMSLTVTDAAITASGTTFPAAAAPGGVVLAHIADQNPLGVPTGLKAKIDWGDGTTSDGTIAAVAGPAGSFDVSGSHTYPDSSTYLVAVTITSNDSGTAQAQAQSTADGKPVPDPPDKGRILDMGRGDDPSMALDPDGTAHLAWSTPAPGRDGDAIVYCELPRGAKACKIKRTFFVDAFQPPVILRDRTGVLYIVISSNNRAQIGGGTLLMTSPDHGTTWNYTFYPVNTGVFQGKIIDATLSQNGRFLYALFGDFVPGDKAQVLATISLDRAGLGSEEDPGKTVPLTGDATVDIPRIPYSVRTVAVLPDGRVALAGYDTRAAKGVPRAAIRVIADADGNAITTPWSPIRAGMVFQLAGSPRSASMLTSVGCGKGVEVSALRGLRLGAPRPLSAEGFLGCGPGFAQDLFVDSAGGRHAVWFSDRDGCQGTGPHEDDRTCMIYRRARPGGDFGPKTTIATVPNPGPVQIGAAPDGLGWVAWRELVKKDNQYHVRITPTFTSSEKEHGKHRIALSFSPGSECAKRDPVTIGVRVSGPQAGKPRVTSVAWSSSAGFLPRRRTDSSAPFSMRLSVDRRQFYGLSSTGSIVFTATVGATVRYRVGSARHVDELSQVLSFYCNIKFDKVK